MVLVEAVDGVALAGEVLIRGSAIKAPRKSREINKLQISNRR
jgi:hypothetical protein